MMEEWVKCERTSEVVIVGVVTINDSMRWMSSRREHSGSR